MTHRLRFNSEAEARQALIDCGIVNSDGTVDQSKVCIIHIGPIRPDGCPGCLNTPSNEAPATCAVVTGSGPCPVACWHVDIIGDIPEGAIPGEIFVNSPKHTFL